MAKKMNIDKVAQEARKQEQNLAKVNLMHDLIKNGQIEEADTELKKLVECKR